MKAGTKTLLQNLALAGASLLLCFAALETVLTVIEARRPGAGKTLQQALEESERAMPDPRSHVGSVRGLVRPSPLPGVVFSLKPGMRATFKGGPVETNRAGYRDRERTLEKAEGAVRLATLGDSVTFGWGVEFAAIFQQRLEKRLNARGDGRRYEVLNFGVPAYSTAQEVAAFAADGLRYDPDAVLLIVVGNDFRRDAFGDEPDPNVGALGGATLRFLRDQEQRLHERLGGVRQMIAQLRRLRDLTAPRGLPVLGILYEGVVEPDQRHHPNPHLDADLRQAFTEFGFIYLDYHLEMRQQLLRKGWEDATRYWLAPPKDAHPNEAGHEFIASLFYRGLRQAGILTPQGFQRAHPATVPPSESP